MEDLIRFLKQNYKDFASQQEGSEFSKARIEYLEKLNVSFKSQNLEESKNRFKRHLFPEPGQIWTIKDHYIDFRGLEQQAAHPFLVIIISDVKELEEEPFVRVHVVSPFTQLGSEEDIICNDASIIGFPFLIEKWNEQPMLLELLEECVGRYSYQFTKEEKDAQLSKWQSEFRTEEVSKARYLNNSISSLLYFLEHRQKKEGGIVVSMAERTYIPKLTVGGVEEPEHPYAIAAKLGNENEDEALVLQEPDLPFQMSIKKAKEGFVISVTPYYNLQLFDASKAEILGVSSRDKIIFSKVNKGAYKLTGPTLSNPIKFRIK